MFYANTTVIITTVAVVATTSLLLWSLYKKSKRREIPTSWRKVGNLSNIFLYPIKSIRFVEVNEADCTILGLKNGILRDRTLMVVDDKNNFITARSYPELLKVTAEQDGEELVICHEEKEDLRVCLKEVAKKKEITCTVWGTKVPVCDCGPAAAEWFSRLILKTPSGLKLVYYARSDPTREIRGKNTFLKYYYKSDTGALPDETPFNLMNLSSVEDLNSRLDEDATPINPIQFRPNFFIKGAQALDEDKWQFVKIGDNIFEVVKACQRCVFTTIDPETGVKSGVGEPLKTLNKYRQYTDPFFLKKLGTAPRMGLQMTLRSQPSKIKVSDSVYVA